jgi:hypothetical protein
MKTLNRPMFRYGGPIKEGIMSGMKEKQAINTVGSPLAPKDETGRGGYAIPLLYGAGMGLARLAPLAMRGFRAAQGLFGKRKFVKDIGTKLPLKPGGAPFTPVKNIFEPNKLGAYLMASPEFKFATGAGGKASKFVGGALKGLSKSPLGIALTAGTMTDILPGGRPFGPDKYLPNILGQRFDEEGNKIPGTGIFNPDRVEEGEAEGLKRVDELGATDKKVDPKVLKELNDDRIERTKKRYYELMGIDKMNKEATYDSLIDASKIIQQEGGDLKGSIKSGSLQSQLISAISKNLDKSTALKRQIDAAVLKGEIEKDIKGADTTDKRLKEARIKALDRAEKQSGAAGIISQIIAKDGTISGSQTASVLRADGIGYDTVLQDKLFTDFQKDNPTKDEVDFLISKGTALPDGRYVIGARLVEKKGNEVAFIL